MLHDNNAYIAMSRCLAYANVSRANTPKHMTIPGRNAAMQIAREPSSPALAPLFSVPPPPRLSPLPPAIKNSVTLPKVVLQRGK